MSDFFTPSNSASCTLIAFRVRSKSCALSARFLPPSMPADVTAKARYVVKQCISSVRQLSYVQNPAELLRTLSSSLTLFRLSIVALRVRISLPLISNCCLRSWTSPACASRFAAYCASSLFCRQKVRNSTVA